jgi:hypothetical protein
MWIFHSEHIALISLASTVLFRNLPLNFSSTLSFPDEGYAWFVLWD